MVNIKLKQVALWLRRCKTNIENFNNIYRSLSKDEKLKYIRYQYHLIKLIDSVLDGKTNLSGFNFQQDQDKLTVKEKIKSETKQM